MKEKIHPNYLEAHVTCTCGNEFTTRSTRQELHVEVCSNCHPFYTGRQKLVDTGGRVERFQRRVARGRLHSAQKAKAKAAAAPPPLPTPAAAPPEPAPAAPEAPEAPESQPAPPAEATP